MTQAEKIISIGTFEMNPKVDFCKDCRKCDLEIQTMEFHFINEPNVTEIRAVCKYADVCQMIYERSMRDEE
jgi:hypothetical protein